MDASYGGDDEWGIDADIETIDVSEDVEYIFSKFVTSDGDEDVITTFTTTTFNAEMSETYDISTEEVHPNEAIHSNANILYISAVLSFIFVLVLCVRRFFKISRQHDNITEWTEDMELNANKCLALKERIKKLTNSKSDFVRSDIQGNAAFVHELNIVSSELRHIFLHIEDQLEYESIDSTNNYNTQGNDLKISSLEFRDLFDDYERLLMGILREIKDFSCLHYGTRSIPLDEVKWRVDASHFIYKLIASETLQKTRDLLQSDKFLRVCEKETAVNLLRRPIFAATSSSASIQSQNERTDIEFSIAYATECEIRDKEEFQATLQILDNMYKVEDEQDMLELRESFMQKVRIEGALRGGNADESLSTSLFLSSLANQPRLSEMELEGSQTSEKLSIDLVTQSVECDRNSTSGLTKYSESLGRLSLDESSILQIPSDRLSAEFCKLEDHRLRYKKEREKERGSRREEAIKESKRRIQSEREKRRQQIKQRKSNADALMKDLLVERRKLEESFAHDLLQRRALDWILAILKGCLIVFVFVMISSDCEVRTNFVAWLLKNCHLLCHHISRYASHETSSMICKSAEPLHMADVGDNGANGADGASTGDTGSCFMVSDNDNSHGMEDYDAASFFGSERFVNNFFQVLQRQILLLWLQTIRMSGFNGDWFENLVPLCVFRIGLRTIVPVTLHYVLSFISSTISHVVLIFGLVIVLWGPVASYLDSAWPIGSLLFAHFAIHQVVHWQDKAIAWRVYALTSYGPLKHTSVHRQSSQSITIGFNIRPIILHICYPILLIIFAAVIGCNTKLSHRVSRGIPLADPSFQQSIGNLLGCALQQINKCAKII